MLRVPEALLETREKFIGMRKIHRQASFHFRYREGGSEEINLLH